MKMAKKGDEAMHRMIHETRKLAKYLTAEQVKRLKLIVLKSLVANSSWMLESLTRRLLQTMRKKGNVIAL